jgi:hypothetical protein
VSLARLTREEIFTRLFLLFYAPQFVWFALRFFFGVIPPEDVRTSWVAVLAGLVLVFATVFRDATVANLAAPRWAAISLIPFVGWWLYARARVPARVPSTFVTRSSLVSIFNIFASQRLRLVTSLPPADCATRLRSRVVSMWSPLSWFARSADRPLIGRVSDHSFALKVRHPMARPTMFDEARGSLAGDPRGTAIELRIGVSRFDRGFAVLWVGFVVLWTGIFFGTATSSPAGASPQDTVLLPLGMIGFFVALVGLLRWIGRSDHAALVEILTRELEARDDASRPA